MRETDDRTFERELLGTTSGRGVESAWFARHARSIKHLVTGFTPRAARRRLRVSVPWREGVAPHAVEVTAYDVRVDEVTALLVESGQDLGRYANIGTFLGLAQVAPDADGHRWFDAVRFRFGADELAAVLLTFGFGAIR